MVGTTSLFAREELTRYFKGEFMMQIKTALSQMMYQNKISILWINSYLTAIAAITQGQLEPFFNEYGLSLKRFQVNSVTVPEDDPSYIIVKESLAEAARRKIQGVTYQDEQRFALAHKAVINPGTSSVVANGIGGVISVAGGGTNVIIECPSFRQDSGRCDISIWERFGNSKGRLMGCQALSAS